MLDSVRHFFYYVPIETKYNFKEDYTMTLTTIIANVALALTPAHVPSVNSQFVKVGVVTQTQEAAYQNVNDKECYKHIMIYGHGTVGKIDCDTVTLNKDVTL